MFGIRASLFLSGLFFLEASFAVQAKVDVVKWNNAVVPKLASADALLFRDPAPATGDGRLGNLTAVLDSHQLIQPKGWSALVAKVRQKEGDIEKLALANKLINAVPFLDNTGGKWFSPAQLLKRGGGVCKDYAVAKYTLLRDAGFDVDKLRIASITPRLSHPGETTHVVLAAAPEGSEPVILSNKKLSVEVREMREQGVTLKERVKEVQKYGITEANAGTGNELLALADYGKDRGILWAGNEAGVVPLRPALNKKPPIAKKPAASRYCSLPVPRSCPIQLPGASTIS